MGKSLQLQIRVSEAEKNFVRQMADTSGQDMSSWVLQTLLSSVQVQFARRVKALLPEKDRQFATADLIDFLQMLPAQGFSLLGDQPASMNQLPEYWQNYVAALVEQAAHQKKTIPPDWTRDIPPMTTPCFATELTSLQMHLLTKAPIAFRKRNLFVDAGVGDRV